MKRVFPLSLMVVLAACACAGVAVTTATAPAGAEPVSGPVATVVNLSEAARRSPSPDSPVTIAALAQGERAFLGVLELPGGGAVPEHQDASEEYIYVLSGGGTITVDGQAHTLTAGSAVFMPAGATVSYQNGEEPLVAVQVFAGTESAAKYSSWK